MCWAHFKYHFTSVFFFLNTNKNIATECALKVKQQIIGILLVFLLFCAKIPCNRSYTLNNLAGIK